MRADRDPKGYSHRVRIPPGYFARAIVRRRHERTQRPNRLRERSIVESVAALDFDTPTLPGATTRVLGSVNIVADPNIPVALGVSTSEDLVVVARSTSDLDLFIGPPRVQFADTDGLQVQVVVWRQVAFTAGRLPGALGIVSGTGWVAPTP